MPSHLQLNPTFGIEIECILLSVNEDCPLVAVHDSLSRSTKAQCARCGTTFDYNLPLHPLHASVAPDAKCSRWTVADDSSLGLSKEERNLMGMDPEDMRIDEPSWSPLGDEFPIEIKSRVLTWDFEDTEPVTDEHVHRITAQEEVKIAYQLLHEDFVQNENAALRMLVNPSCSTHVHIGNGSDGFSVQTVKNMISTVVACERPLDSLHSTHRIGGRNIEDYVDPVPYNFPWSADLTSVAEYMLDGDLSNTSYPASVFNRTPELKESVKQSHVSAWLKVIRHAETLQHLQDLQLGRGHYSTVNLENLAAYTGDEGYVSSFDAMQTIEFRQHAGTLSAQKVLAWVEVLVKMVQFADSHSGQYIAKLCDSQWAAFDHDIHDLLRLIDVSGETQAYYTAQAQACWDTTERNNGPRLENYIPKNQSRRSRATAVLAWARDLAEQASAPQNIQQRIKDKFLTGCYGQFGAQYLDQIKHIIDMTDAQQEMLTIGWRPEPVFVNKHAWNAPLEANVTVGPSSPTCDRPMDDSARILLNQLLSDMHFAPYRALVEVA